MAELIAAQTPQADSADITLSTGASTTLLLKSGTLDAIPPGSIALIQAKSASGTQYVTIGQLDSGNPIKVLSAAGVFRVRKQISPIAVGVDQT